MNKYQFRRLANRILRHRLIHFYSSFSKLVSDEIEGHKVYYNLNTDIGRKIYFGEQFEKYELFLCRDYLSENSIVLDIGANIGLHSLYFSKIAHNGLIIALEPSPKTYNLLTKNVYNMKNIVPINIAISDKAQILNFYEAEDDAYSSLKDTKRKRICDVHPVLVFSIDQLLSEIQLAHIDLIKIDVEGFEHNVIKGMDKTIEKFRPIIFCEIYKGKNSNLAPEETVDLICDQKYSAFIVSNGKLIEYHGHDDRFYNYFFFPVAEE